MTVDGRAAEIRASWSPAPGPMMQLFIDGEWVDSSTGAHFQCFDTYAEMRAGVNMGDSDLRQYRSNEDRHGTIIRQTSNGALRYG